MPDDPKQRVILIAGPTASGKSALALDLAARIGGEIVNADAMQVYRDLSIISARPSTEDETCAPHHLYGVIDGAERFSAGRWAQAAMAKINEINERRCAAIIVGGTGLYFKALVEGLSPIPDIDDATRKKAIDRFEALGAEAFREEVLVRDPAMDHLPAGDTQRLIRAWEIFEATGKPLSHFQQLPRQPLLSVAPSKAVLSPSREALYRRCDERAAHMLEQGAIDEVKALLARGLDPSLPIMKTLGVREIGGLINGEYDEPSALAMLQQNTRRFAKRQMTWLRGQAAGWPRYEQAETLLAALSG